MTDLEKAAIRLHGAIDRHASTRELRKQLVRERCKELRRELKSRKAPCKPLPLFDGVTA